MKWLEKYKLNLRAKKYKDKDDVGGVAYLYETINPGKPYLISVRTKADTCTLCLDWLARKVK
jgi:hypothetical protein